MTDVWDRAPFDQTHLLVLLALADQANDAGRCWPSAAHIAKRARCSDRYVRQVISELQSAGWLSIEERRGRSSMYTVTTPEPRFTPEPQLRGEPQATPEKPSPLSPSSPHPGTPVQGTPEPQFTQNRKRTTKEPSGAAKRGTRIPADFTVNDKMRNWAADKTPSADLDVETEKFIDHWGSSTGASATKCDWVAAWRNWMRNAEQRTPAWKKQQTQAAPATVPASEYTEPEDDYVPSMFTYGLVDGVA